MKSLSLHVVILRKSATNDVFPMYASSKEELDERVKDWIEEAFKDELSDLDETNSKRFIENESDDDTLIKLYKEHLDELDADNSFEIHSNDEVTLHLNHKLDILDIDIA